MGSHALDVSWGSSADDTLEPALQVLNECIDRGAEVGPLDDLYRRRRSHSHKPE